MSDESKAKEITLNGLMEKYGIGRKDAMIIDCIDDLIITYQKFLVDTLGFEKNKSSDGYEVNITLQDFYFEYGKILIAMTNIQTSLRNEHPQVATVFAPRIEAFSTTFKSIGMAGKKDTVLKLQAELMVFQTDLQDLIKSKQSEKLLETYIFATEERAGKVWSNGLKKLAKHKEARVLLDWLVEEGKGIPLSIATITNLVGQAEGWVNGRLNEIMENAPELISMKLAKNKVIAYYVPKEFHGYHFSSGG